MTIETQTRDVLVRAADQVDVEPPPIDAMLGSVARRRRRIAAAIAGLSAAAVVVAVAVVNSGGDERRAPSTSTPTAPTTAPGTRLVGMNGVMVSVPLDWGTNRVKCGTALADTVYFDTGEVRLCRVVPTRPVSVLRISDVGENDSAFQLAQEAHQPTTIDGVEAFRRPTRNSTPACPMSRPMDVRVECGGVSYDGVLYVPSLGVVFSVSATSRGVVDPILDSAHLIPDGYVAIPLNTTGSELQALGLQVDLRGDIDPDRVAPTQPQVGTVVAIGSGVSVGPVVDGLVPDAHLPVTVSKPMVECGSSGGFAMSVLIQSPSNEVVDVQVVQGRRVVGSSTMSLAAGNGERVSMDLEFLRMSGATVDVYVRGGTDMLVGLGKLESIDLGTIKRNYEVCF
jgi:hypothetical protein